MVEGAEGATITGILQTVGSSTSKLYIALQYPGCLGISTENGGAIRWDGTGCKFIRLGGNAIALSGHAWHTTITASEFFKIGNNNKNNNKS
jgi:hypothetical protein